MDIEHVYRTKQLSSISFISFEELGYSSKDEREKLMKFLINNDDDALTLTRLKELKNALAKAIEELPEKERLVIHYRIDDANGHWGKCIGVVYRG